MTLLNQNLAGDLVPVTGTLLHKFTLAWQVLLYDITFTDEIESNNSYLARWTNYKVKCSSSLPPAEAATVAVVVELILLQFHVLKEKK